MWRAATNLQARAREMIDADQPPDAPHRRRPLWTEIPRGRNGVEGRSFREGDAVWSVVAITRAHLDRFALGDDALPPDLLNGWLSFECGEQRRRYAPIPPDWQTMLPHHLAELCRRATVVTATPPAGTPASR